MAKLKILFQEPFVSPRDTFGKFSGAGCNNTFPYGIASIASYIKDKGYNASYLDPVIEKISLKAYLDFVKREDINVIGMGSTTVLIKKTIETFKLIKKYFPDIITVLGGPHGTLFPAETMAESGAVDYIILGEGEKPFLFLLDCLAQGKREYIRHIDGICFKQDNAIIINQAKPESRLEASEIPIPCFEIFPMRKYVAQITYAKRFPSYSVVASRGCPYRCAFCSASVVFGNKVRYKPVGTLIQELDILKKEYGARGIMFFDSTFTVDRRWMEEFCRESIKAKIGLPWACNSRVDTVDEELLSLMKDAGCWAMLYGIESANQKSLDLMNKKITVQQNTIAVELALKLGYFVYTTYILCLPGEDEKDVLSTIDYARGLGNHLANFYLPVPYPSTKLRQICHDTGGLRQDAQWQDYNAWDYSNPVYVNPLIGKEKMVSLYKKAYFNFYSNPQVWLKHAAEILLLKQSPYKYWLGLKAFLNFCSSN